VAAATVLTIGVGIAVLRIVSGSDSDQVWAAETQRTVVGLDNQLAALRTATQRWQAQPAELRERRLDIAAKLLGRTTELQQRRDTLASALAGYDHLTRLQAAIAAGQKDLDRTQQVLSDPGNPARAQQAQQTLDDQSQRQRRLTTEAQHAADTVRLAQRNSLPEDAAVTASLIDAVGKLAPADAPMASPPTPSAVPAPPAAQLPAPPAPDGATLAAPPPPSSPAPDLAGPDTAPAGALGWPAPSSPPGSLAPTPTGQPPVVRSRKPRASHRPAAEPSSQPEHAPRQNVDRRSDPTTSQIPTTRTGPTVRVLPTVSPAPSNEPSYAPPAPTPLYTTQAAPTYTRQAAPTYTPQATPTYAPAAPSYSPPSQVYAQPPSNTSSRSSSSQSSSRHARDLPSEQQVKDATGDDWIARQSQTPEGQEVMRGIFGGDE
jgi:hypothetical protein